jgi:hypothetical protein
MPEPIGGRELKWEWSRAFSRFGGFLNGFAGFLGWTLVLLLPIAGVTWVYLQMCMPAHGIKFPAWTGFPWAGFVGFIKGFDSAFFTKLLQLAEAWGLLIICFVCSVITSIGFISHFFSKKRMSNSEENAPSPGSAGGRAPDLGPETLLHPHLIDLLDGGHEGAGRVQRLFGRDRFGIRGHGG